MKLGAWIRSLFAEAPPKPRPPGWNKTLRDLSAENRSLTGDEIEWAREYEREQLRAWARFPKDGDEYEAARELRVSYVLHFRAPYSTGGEATLPKGARVRVAVHAFDAEPVGVDAVPTDPQLEQQLVPEADRLGKNYDGYSLPLTVEQLNRDFVLVKSAAG